MTPEVMQTLAAGAVGIAGTILGTLITHFLTRRRERRAASSRQRRAVNALAGELLDAASILDTAMNRGRWWPPGDAPRDAAWQRYNDDLADLLDDDTWHRLRTTYEALRSLDAMREDPDRRARPWEPLHRRNSWEARWRHAPDGVLDCWNGVWAALGVLRERYPAMARPADRRALEVAEAEGGKGDAAGVRPHLEGGPYRPHGG